MVAPNWPFETPFKLRVLKLVLVQANVCSKWSQWRGSEAAARSVLQGGIALSTSILLLEMLTCSKHQVMCANWPCRSTYCVSSDSQAENSF